MDSSALWIIALFVVGYLGIIFEHTLRIDKAAVALLTGVGCWMLFFNAGPASPEKMVDLHHLLAGISQILFFLMCAMLIVEVIDAHHGFETIGSLLNIKSKYLLFWIALMITFFVSAVMDNLTTIIVMITLLQKLIKDTKQRLIFTTALVVSANAGGAWTPIGDVTTTMLWIADTITTWKIMKALFLPSFISMIVFGLLLMPQLPAKADLTPRDETKKRPIGSGIFMST